MTTAMKTERNDIEFYSVKAGNDVAIKEDKGNLSSGWAARKMWGAVNEVHRREFR